MQRKSAMRQSNRTQNGGGYRHRNRQEKSGRWRVRVRLAAVLVAVCYLFVVIEAQIRPILRAVVEYESREYAITSFNQAVEAHLAQYPDAYEGLYEVIWDVDGVPTSVVANSYQINTVRSQLVQSVMDALLTNQESVYDFYLGRLTGIQMLATRGPLVVLEMQPKSYVIATIYHTIETEGENQTLFSVYATFTVQINVTMAGYLQTLTIENDVLLWQNLLLGRVPDVNV